MTRQWKPISVVSADNNNNNNNAKDEASNRVLNSFRPFRRRNKFRRLADHGPLSPQSLTMQTAESSERYLRVEKNEYIGVVFGDGMTD